MACADGGKVDASGRCPANGGGGGSDQTVNVRGISLGGADAGNYNLVNTQAVTKASILRPGTGTFADARLVRTMATPLLEAIKAGCGAVAAGISGTQDQTSSRRDTLSDAGGSDASRGSGLNRAGTGNGACN